MDIKKIIREVLTEGYGQKPMPRQFDHLKWKLDGQQKHFLADFLEVHPESLKNEDIDYASKVTGIPKDSLLSIMNTLGNPQTGDRRKPELESRFESNKPFTAKEYDFDPKYRTDVVNFKKISKEDLDKKRHPMLKDKREHAWAVEGNKPPELERSAWVPTRHRMDEDLIEYIKDRLKPKGVSINYNNQIQVDQEPTVKSESEERFYQEKRPFKLIETVLEEYNEIFGTKYIASDHVDLVNTNSKCYRTFIDVEKIDENRMIWNSENKSYIKYKYATEQLKQEFHKNTNSRSTLIYTCCIWLGLE